MYKKVIATARKEKARSVRTGLTPQQVQEFKEVRKLRKTIAPCSPESPDTSFLFAHGFCMTCYGTMTARETFVYLGRLYESF